MRPLTCMIIRFEFATPVRQAQPVDTWISDYAMNPNCREDSPKDVVFLFESKPGWNQHGGPELFTFDNHDSQAVAWSCSMTAR